MSKVIENCTNCEFRHGGCVIIDEDFVKMLEQDEKCPHFVLGKCFYCAQHQLGDTSQCSDIFYPCGCENFKDGQGYEEYLLSLKKSESDEHFEVENDIALISRFNERDKGANRRKDTQRHKNKLLRKAKENNYIRGPWFSEKKGRVLIGSRGKRSKWLKRQTYKRARKLDVEKEEKISRGLYHRLFDYWWELD